MYDFSMPLWERYLMTIEEASSYFRIGENKLRRIANEYKEECVVMNGNRMLIKKKKLEHPPSFSLPYRERLAFFPGFLPQRASPGRKASPGFGA